MGLDGAEARGTPRRGPEPEGGTDEGEMPKGSTASLLPPEAATCRESESTGLGLWRGPSISCCL